MGWQTLAALPQPSDEAGIATDGRFIYVAGGFNPNDGFLSRVIRAPIARDGSLGDWESAGPDLPAAVAANQAIIKDGFLYSIGGDEGSGRVNRYSYAPLQPNGSWGTWVSGTLPVALSTSVAVALDQHLFLFGGAGDGGQTPITDIYRADIGADGSLSGWTIVGQLPFQDCDYYGGTYRNGRVYLKDASGKVAVASIKDGNVTPWTQVDAPRTSSPAFVASADAVFLMGGYHPDSFDELSAAWRATVTPSGLTAFEPSPTGDLPLAVDLAGAVSTGAFIYVLGGEDETFAAQTQVIAARVNRLFRDVALDLALLLANADQGLTLGQNLFAGPVLSDATLPTPWVQFQTYGGNPPVPYLAGTNLVTVNVQVRVVGSIASFSQTQELAATVFEALHQATTDDFVSVTARDPQPLYAGETGQGQQVFICNFQAVYEGPARTL